MLGNTLNKYFPQEEYNVFTFNRSDVNLSNCSFYELSDKLNKFIDENSIDLIVNCAGVIKQRSTSSSDMIHVNSVIPHWLQEISENNKIKFIHITTDCVFDGVNGKYNESYSHNAMDEYGRSKSLGEPENSTVIRTSIIGEEEKNKLSLFEWVKSNSNKEIRGYTNHFWNGVTCLQLGKFINDIIKNDGFWEGVYHLHSNDVNKFDLVSIINEVYNFNIKINEFVDDKNPADRTMRTNKKMSFNLNIPHLYKQIEEMKDFHESLRNKELGEYYDNMT